MGLLNTVKRKQELSSGINTSLLVNNDEKKILLNINSRIEDLKVQNMENAKFLRGISRKIENELQQMREVEANKSIEVLDDSSILKSIERVELSLQEINSNDVLVGIEKISQSINDFNQLGVMEEISKINRSIGEMNSGDVIEEVKKINETIETINFDSVLKELSKINESMSQVNSDVLLLEIDKINNSLKAINSDSVLKEIAKANDKLDEIKISDIVLELHRIEELVSEINNKAVIAELERVKQLINEKNSDVIMEKLDEKISNMKSNDYTEKLAELEDLLKQNQRKLAEIDSKVVRISTMPSMLRTIIEKSNENNLEKLEFVISEQNNKQNKKIDMVKIVVSINLWASLLGTALIIANIFGAI